MVCARYFVVGSSRPCFQKAFLLEKATSRNQVPLKGALRAYDPQSARRLQTSIFYPIIPRLAMYSMSILQRTGQNASGSIYPLATLLSGHFGDRLRWGQTLSLTRENLPFAPELGTFHTVLITVKAYDVWPSRDVLKDGISFQLLERRSNHMAADLECRL